MSEQIAPRLTIMGYVRDTTHWRLLVLLQDAEGSAQYRPLAEVLEQADQISGLDWLQSKIREGHLRLCAHDAEIWARWEVALNREVCHA